ncbi:hypothetical protein ACH3VR_14120 [Microbacterium sp. B2969]|uniref:Uncharacterized protein n=1 Tax=Microbacterium alkaliflavum TaxID=3248839 RepID=A0ABW7QDH9_9MICO
MKKFVAVRMQRHEVFMAFEGAPCAVDEAHAVVVQVVQLKMLGARDSATGDACKGAPKPLLLAEPAVASREPRGRPQER